MSLINFDFLGRNKFANFWLRPFATSWRYCDIFATSTAGSFTFGSIRCRKSKLSSIIFAFLVARLQRWRDWQRSESIGRSCGRTTAAGQKKSRTWTTSKSRSSSWRETRCGTWSRQTWRNERLAKKRDVASRCHAGSVKQHSHRWYSQWWSVLSLNWNNCYF